MRTDSEELKPGMKRKPPTTICAPRRCICGRELNKDNPYSFYFLGEWHCNKCIYKDDEV